MKFNLSAANIRTLGVGAHNFTISQATPSASMAMNNNPVANATFTLTVKPAPSPLPKTGDGFPLGGLLTLLGITLTAMCWLGLRLHRGKLHA